VDVEIHVFLTSALAKDEWSASRLCRFTPGERAPIPTGEGGWVDPRDGLDDMEKLKLFILPRLQLRLLDRTARRKSLADYATAAHRHQQLLMKFTDFQRHVTKKYTHT
jgi:hypothetical protein